MLRLYDDLEDPLNHVASPLGIYCELMRSYRDSNCLLNLRKDAVRRNFWDGFSHPKGALRLFVERVLPEF